MDTRDQMQQSSTSLLRILTFGALTIQYRTSRVENWQNLDLTSPPERLQGRGLSLPLTILKMLVCQPNRHASRSLLQETLWPTMTCSQAQKRVEGNMNILRTLFRTTGIHQSLIHTTHGSEGNGYRLEAYPVVWIDVDGFSYFIAAAARAQRLGDDPLAYWEKAYQLVERKEFLADDLYSEWNQLSRCMVQDNYRHCVLSLSACYQQRHSTSEALQVLRTYVLDHPTDEDALRPLLELLGDLECYQEASEYFERAEKALSQEHELIDSHTKDLYLHVQAKQLIRSQKLLLPSTSSHVIQLEPIPRRNDGYSPPGPSTRGEKGGEDTWFDLKKRLIHALVRQWQGRALYCCDLQFMVDQELSMADFLPFSSPQTRRTFLQTLLASLISPMLFKRVLAQPTNALLEEFLPQVATSITTCQQLLHGNGFDIVEQTLPLFLPVVEDLARHPSSYRSTAAGLTAQAYILSALVALHRYRIAECESLYQRALLYSQYAQLPVLHVAVIKQTATRLLEDHKTEQALQVYGQGLPFLKDDSHPIPSRLAGLIYVGMATAYAQMRDKPNADLLLGKAQESFFDSIPSEKLSYVDTGPYHYLLWKGLLHVEFQQLEEADDTFAQVNSLNISSERTRLEIVNQQAHVAVLAKNKDKAIQYVIHGATGARSLGSQKRLQEIITITQQAQIQWPHERDIQELSGLFSVQEDNRFRHESGGF